jgi:hypothetical protein
MEREPLTVDLLPDGSDALAGAFLAADYHGGQYTALYALASSGSLELRTGDGLGPLVRELVEAVRVAEEQEQWEDSENLGALLAWCESVTLCADCGIPCDGNDAVADDSGLAWCGSFYGNGCADSRGGF